MATIGKVRLPGTTHTRPVIIDRNGDAYLGFYDRDAKVRLGRFGNGRDLKLAAEMRMAKDSKKR